MDHEGFKARLSTKPSTHLAGGVERAGVAAVHGEAERAGGRVQVHRLELARAVAGALVAVEGEEAQPPPSAPAHSATALSADLVLFGVNKLDRGCVKNPHMRCPTWVEAVKGEDMAGCGG